jgi:hypothetical protein
MLERLLKYRSPKLLMKSLVLIGFILSFSLFAHAQSEGQMLPIIIQGKDTIITCTLQEVVVVSKRTFKNPIEQAQFNLLKKNILIVYPYAKEAGQLYRDINEQMQAMDKKKERKKFVKQKEEELDELYSNSLKNLTVSQGDILVKLIARETGQDVYGLIREFKSPLSAFYWNKLSGLYGYSLKQEYDPQQERDIEMIVRSIEGTL